MKVLVVYHYYAHYREAVLRELIEHSEHEIHIISGDSTNHAGLNKLEEVRLSTGDKQPIEFLRNVWFKKSFLWQKGLVGIALSREYDAVIVLGNINFVSTWLAIAIARLRRKRVLMWTHGLYGSEKPALAWLRCQFYKLAHSLLLYGHHAKSLLADKGFSEERLQVIYNSLDVAEQESLYCAVSSREREAVLSKLFSKPDLPLVVFIGRLTPQKKLLLLVDAVAQLSARHSMPVNLLFIGDGSERKLLEARAQELGIIEHVHFYGACYDDRENAELLYHSDVCVAPGEVGLTAMHVLIYGTPVITHDTAPKQMPEFEAVVPGRSGLFFSEGSLDSLSSSLLEWFTNHNDREQIREDCRDVIYSKYSPNIQRQLIDTAIKF